MLLLFHKILIAALIWQCITMVLELRPIQCFLNVVINGVSRSYFCDVSKTVAEIWKTLTCCTKFRCKVKVLCTGFSQGTSYSGYKQGFYIDVSHWWNSKLLESKGSQRSTMIQVHGNCLYSHKCGSALWKQIWDIAPSCSVPPSSAKHIHWRQWDLRNRFRCWYTEKSLV